MADTLEQLAYEGGRLLKLLDAIVSTEGGPRALLNALGWDLPPGSADIGLAALDLGALGAKVDALESALASGVTGIELGAKFADVLVATEQAFVALRGTVAALSASGDYLDKTQMTSQLMPRLSSLLLVTRLGAASPFALLVLQAFGVVKVTRMVADPAIYQVDHLRTEFDWNAFGRLFTAPLALIEARYGWGTPAFDGRSFVTNLSALAEALGEPVRVRELPRRTEEQLTGLAVPAADTDPLPQLIASLVRGDAAGGLDVGISLFPLRPTSAGAADGGVALHPFAYGTADLIFPLTPTLTLELESTAALDSGVVLQFRPGQSPSLHAGLVGNTGIVAGLAGSAGVRLTHAAPTGSSLGLLGLPGGGIVETASMSFGAGVALAGSHLTPSFVAQLKGGHAALKADGADSFLSSILPAGGLDLTFDLGLRWSGAQGFSFEGSVSAAIDLPFHIGIGPFFIDTVHIGLLPTAAGLGLEISVSGGTALGPVSAAFDRLGTTADLAFHDGNLGPIDLALGFKPPSGIGLAIDAGGVVTGGGFLFHDPAQALYAGVMQLSLDDSISLSAYGLIATRLPDGSPGYSLLVFITAEGFQPIPLGMGFTLQGIGGMVAVNRSFDQDVIRQGLKNDTLGGLLFPRDPVGNAPALIRALAAAFPANRGSYLVGILAKIGWATPTLVLLELALILEFGARKRLLVLGRISAILPSAENDLIRLVLDAMGVIDFDQGTAAIDAVLVDSRLAHAYPLTGAMALRANWGSGPGSTFVLAVGGLHPQFAPPADLPALPRIAIALSSGSNPRLVCQAYFAITANTVQFGAAASLHAAAYGFSVDGDVGFDVLLQILPLHFIADFNAKLQLKHGSTNLFSVSLEGELEGPRPLRVSGSASFEIFWCSFSIRFDATLVKGEGPPPPSPIDLLGQLLQALAAPTSWSVQTPRSHGVSLRKLAPGAPLTLDPLGLLVIKQQVVPLATSRDIDLYGGAPVSGARRFALTAAIEGAAQSTSPIQALFAPAQFFSMSDEDKLAAPSFESMDAGLAIGDEAIQFGAVVSAPLTYESIVVDTLPQPATRPDRYTLPSGQLLAQAHSGAAAKAPVRRSGSARYAQVGATPAAVLEPLAWTVQPLGDGPAASVDPQARTWSEYRAALATLNRVQADWQMVPRLELAQS